MIADPLQPVDVVIDGECHLFDSRGIPIDEICVVSRVRKIPDKTVIGIEVEDMRPVDERRDQDHRLTGRFGVKKFSRALRPDFRKCRHRVRSWRLGEAVDAFGEGADALFDLVLQCVRERVAINLF